MHQTSHGENRPVRNVIDQEALAMIKPCSIASAHQQPTKQKQGKCHSYFSMGNMQVPESGLDSDFCLFFTAAWFSAGILSFPGFNFLIYERP